MRACIVWMQGEGNGHFVKRVQAAVAGELGVEVADLTQAQKQKLIAAAGRNI